MKAEEIDGVKSEIKAEYKKVDDEIQSLIAQVNDAVAKAAGERGFGAELEEANARVQQIAAAYRGEFNKNYVSALSLHHRPAEKPRRSDQSHRPQLHRREAEARRREQGQRRQDRRHRDRPQRVQERPRLGAAEEHRGPAVAPAQVDTFNTEQAKLQNEVQNLQNKLRQLDEDMTKKLVLSQQNVREWRDRVERKENVLDLRDGHITFVDYNRGEVQANVVRSQGARPQMQFAIFDAASPGIPTDKPKGTIELVSVGDQFSIARITKTFDSISPIRVGDIVYSSAWSPNEPMRFALIGKIDMNRDNRDDREDLKRMIQQAGGIVDYDLPPPGAGKESGKLTGSDSWYVIDERPPLIPVAEDKNVTANENTDFLQKQTDAVREARLSGVRPMPIERLLPSSATTTTPRSWDVPRSRRGVHEARPDAPPAPRGRRGPGRAQGRGAAPQEEAPK